MKRILLTAALLLFSAATGLSGAVLFYINQPAGDGSVKTDFEVPQGASSYRTAKNLLESGLIRSESLFVNYLKLTGRASGIKAGIYELHSGMSTSQIADILTAGKVRMTTFTVPEGWHNRQIAEMLAAKGLIGSPDEFLELTRSPEVLSKYGIAAESTEGYLFPDTYTIPLKYPAARIQEAMLRRFFQVLKEVNPEAVSDPFDLQKKVILASIIEREAAKPEELPVMAGVFLNRMQKKMKLESCATVQYLLPKPKQKLLEKDLLISSPYNTYLNKGLPPGPISNPGRAAIAAVYAPQETDALFFVLKPDGSHHFAATYKDHNNAKKMYLDGREGYQVRPD